jgi:hypothetical protein
VVNQSSAAMSATFKNTQAEPLSISSIAISGGTAPADYVLGGNYPLSPGTLGPGENCRITVTFTRGRWVFERPRSRLRTTQPQVRRPSP